MMNKEIDLNCDMGESYGQFIVGNDQAIFPFITSCNIACGFHGGDPLHIENTIKLALKNNVQIGAHPSYPDLMGFGRRPIKMPLRELKSLIKYQIAAVKGLAESLGAEIKYVKPHGALYNSVAENKDEAYTLIDAIQSISAELALMGLAGSPIERIAKELEIKFISEAFADRRYTEEGRLQSRSIKGALITDPEEAARQVVAIAKNGEIELSEGKKVAIQAESFCIHGDNPNAEDLLKAITQSLKNESIQIKPFSL